MKLTVPRAALAAATAHLFRVVERRNTIPILANLLLRTGPDGLSLTATDLDMEATTQVPATITTPGAVTLPAAQLKDIAAKAAGTDIEITADPAHTVHASLRSGRAKFDLHSLPESDFPSLATGDMPSPWSVPAQALRALLETVEFAMSTEETRYYLCGIYLHLVQHNGTPHLAAVATDGHRLALRRMEAPEGSAGMPGVILPRKAVGEMIKMLTAHGTDAAQLAVNTTKLCLEAGGTRLITKLVDGTYPDYARVIPAQGATAVTLKRADLTAAVARVATVISEKGRAVKFAFAEDGLTLSVTGTDTGEATDTVESTHAGPPLEIGFNPTYALHIAAAMASDDMSISLNDAGSPALIAGADDPAAQFVLMPMRI